MSSGSKIQLGVTTRLGKFQIITRLMVGRNFYEYGVFGSDDTTVMCVWVDKIAAG